MEQDKRLGLPRDLGGGLTLRWTRPEDEDALAEFNRWVFADPSGEPDEIAAIQTRELFSPHHPTAKPSDHVLVEDTTTGKIVSSTCFIPQRWGYAGNTFGVARPELVGTDPAFRNRGLVRAQMDVLHALSAERGDLIQAITGIPYFYRQFGYEPALMTPGGKYGLPQAFKPSETEPYQIRRTTEADIPTIMACYDLAARRKLITAVRDEAVCKWDLMWRLPGSDYVHEHCIIQQADGAPAGFLAYQTLLDSRAPILWATVCELLDGESWPLAAPIIMDHLRIEAENTARKQDHDAASVGFDWGDDHPFFRLHQNVLQASVRPFSWLIRIPDLAGFIRHFKPALDDRLQKSPFERHSGELVVTFYRSGLKFVFENGMIVAIDDFQPDSHRVANAGFPGRTFYYVLLGSRTIEELEYAFPDCFVRKQADRVLLETLFPKKQSAVWPV
jgi:predicted N-acetyltransferase YhbS